MYLNRDTQKQYRGRGPAKTPPLKRLRVGRKRRTHLSHAINTPAVPGSARHPFGDMLKSLRQDLGSTPRYAFAQVLGMTEHTLQKLETQPHRSGIKPMLKLLEAFGLALTLDVPDLDTTFGYPELHAAFFAIRCRNADLTQRVLSQRSGVARTTIQNFEHGQPIKLSMLLKLSRTLGARILVVPADQIQACADLELESHNDVNEQAGDVNAEVDQETDEEQPLVIDRYAPTLAEMLGWEKRRVS